MNEEYLLTNVPLGGNANVPLGGNANVPLGGNANLCFLYFMV